MADDQQTPSAVMLFRRDLRSGFPADVVNRSARAHLLALQRLPSDTPDRDIAIAEVTTFLADTALWQDDSSETGKVGS